MPLRFIGRAACVNKSWNYRINTLAPFWSKKFQDEYAPLNDSDESLDSNSCIGRDKYRIATLHMREKRFLEGKYLSWVPLAINSIAYNYPTAFKNLYKKNSLSSQSFQKYEFQTIHSAIRNGSVDSLKEAASVGFIQLKDANYIAMAAKGLYALY